MVPGTWESREPSPKFKSLARLCLLYSVLSGFAWSILPLGNDTMTSPFFLGHLGRSGYIDYTEFCAAGVGERIFLEATWEMTPIDPPMILLDIYGFDIYIYRNIYIHIYIYIFDPIDPPIPISYGYSMMYVQTNNRWGWSFLEYIFEYLSSSWECHCQVAQFYQQK